MKVFQHIGHSIRRRLSKVRIKSFIFFAKLQNKDVVNFLHIGKTGGTSIKNAFSGRKCTLTRRALFIMNNHPKTLKYIPDDEKVFFVVRDPISRFISGFYGRLRQDLPRMLNPWKNGEEEMFKIFQTPNELAEALSSSNGATKETAQKAMRIIGHIKTSYWDWFQSEEYLLTRVNDIVWVGRQENLTSDFESLKQKYNLPKAIRLPTDEIKTHKRPDGYGTTLSELAVENLKVWYKDEYQFIDVLYANGLLKSKYL